MLEIKNVSASRNGETVLDALSISIDGKGVVGILGRRTSGKTALSQIMCGCRDAEYGEVLLDGEIVCRAAKAQKKRIRLVPNELCIDANMTALEYMSFVREAVGVDEELGYRQIKEALELCGLGELVNVRFCALTRGERCRLAIASALLGNPEYIVLDQPFLHLGEQSQNDVRELVLMLGKHKCVVLFSDNADEVEPLCDRIAIMCGGKIALFGELDEIKKKLTSTSQMSIVVRGSAQTALDTVGALEQVVRAELVSSDINDTHSISVEYAPATSMRQVLFDALATKNIPMLSVRESVLTLNDVYSSLTASDAENAERRQSEGAAPKSKRSRKSKGEERK